VENKISLTKAFKY